MFSYANGSSSRRLTPFKFQLTAICGVLASASEQRNSCFFTSVYAMQLQWQIDIGSLVYLGWSYDVPSPSIVYLRSWHAQSPSFDSIIFWYGIIRHFPQWQHWIQWSLWCWSACSLSRNSSWWKSLDIIHSAHVWIFHIKPKCTDSTSWITHILKFPKKRHIGLK